MKVTISFDVDLSQSKVSEAWSVKSVVESWLQAPVSPSMRNPNLDSNEDAIGEALARAGVMSDEMGDFEVAVTE